MLIINCNREVLIVCLSLIIQIPLAIFLGHYYDQKIAMATGYLVSQGLNPYQTSNFAQIFPHPLLNGIIPGIGYPPLWPLLLGAIYRVSYGLVQNIYFYNFMIKIPIIIGNIGLAYLVKNIIIKSHKSSIIAQKAWLFILFNPFVLLSTTAWGDFDTMTAFLCIASLYFASTGKIKSSGVLMALGVVLKPIALPLIGLPLFAPSALGVRKKVEYLLIFLSVGLIGFFGPFYLFNWSTPLTPSTWNAQFKMLGGLTPFNIIELFQPPVLPIGFDVLGFLWVPALIVGYYCIHLNRPKSINDLAIKGAGLTLLFFLTRIWLSEPNITLVLALMLLTITSRKNSFRDFHFLWVLPLIFMFLNWAVPQLFFLPFPSILVSLVSVDQQIGIPRFIGRFAVAVLWQALAWFLTVKLLKSKREKTV